MTYCDLLNPHRTGSRFVHVTSRLVPRSREGSAEGVVVIHHPLGHPPIGEQRRYLKPGRGSRSPAPAPVVDQSEQPAIDTRHSTAAVGRRTVAYGVLRYSDGSTARYQGGPSLLGDLRYRSRRGRHYGHESTD